MLAAGEGEDGQAKTRFYIYITVLHKLGDLDSVSVHDLNFSMAAAVQKFKQCLLKSTEADVEDVILEFVAALPLQFYIGPHARKYS
jgi:DNA phosphorothioation-dependent restriction protein DptG